VVKAKLVETYTRHKGRYGCRRVTSDLRKTGEMVNHKKIQRLMQMLGLKSLVHPKKYRSYRDEVGRVVRNLLERKFDAGSLKI
jgi:putative transposase